MKTKKKIRTLLSILLIGVVASSTLLLTSCGAKSPSDVVKDTLASYQGEDAGKYVEEMTKLELGEQDENIWEAIDKGGDYKEKMADIVKTVKFDVKDEKIDGDNAVVTVTINTKDYCNVALKYLADNYGNIDADVKKIVEENKGKDQREVVYILFEKVLGKYSADTAEYVLKNAKEELHGEIKLPLKKKDGKWELDLSDEKKEDLYNGLIASSEKGRGDIVFFTLLPLVKAYKSI